MKTTQLLHHCNRQTLKLKMTMLALLLTAMQINSHAQITKTNNRYENYGHTLNIGLGIAYYGYLGYTVPFLGLNYEINVARNFTLAPFLGYASYRSNDYYVYHGDRYYYHETVMPMGLKGTYYFDRILGAGPRWDFYLAASLGFNYHRIVWDDGYFGDKNVYRAASPLYADLHIGTEYHLNRNLGLFLDISTGISTFGLAVHHL